MKGGSPELLRKRFLDVGSREFYSLAEIDLVLDGSVRRFKIDRGGALTRLTRLR